MRRSLGLFGLLAFAASLAACGGGGGGGGYTAPVPGGGGGGGVTGVGAKTVGLALPTSAIGVEVDPTWGMVGGYTQALYSQVLAFAPGTTITLRNLGTTIHTLNVLSMDSAHPAAFPANPQLLNTANGTSLDATYRSGNIAPGGTVTVTLNTPGTFLIGCAYHYVTNNMRDVIVVSGTALPGPQATPQPGGGGGSGCSGTYC
jgi:plastocyanin